MPRYFFHVLGGLNHPDLQGTELPDLKAARIEAARFAAALLLDHTDTFWASGELTLRVTSDSDLTLFELLFIVTKSPAVMGW